MMRTAVVLVGTLVIQVQAYAQEDQGPTDAVDAVAESTRITVPAKPVVRIAPKYPQLELRRGRQAWVHVAYCIDEAGTPQNISVLDSVGTTHFENAALDTVETWQFEPSLVKGVPTWQSRNETYIHFAIEGANKGARRTFVRNFKKLQRLINEEKLDEAEALFERIHGDDGLSLYELSKLWGQRVLIEAARGDMTRLRMALQRATASDGEWIDKPSYIQLMSLLVRVEISMGRYAESLSSFKKIVDIAGEDHELVQALGPAVHEVREVVGSDQILTVAGEIRGSGDCLRCNDSWNFRPVRRGLSIGNVAGRLDSIEMRCDHRHFTSDASDQVEWKIPESWGVCRVHIHGEPGTTFEVYELPSG